MANVVTLEVQGGVELRALIRQLKAQERGDLRRRLDRNIRRAGDPVLRDLRTAVMHVDVTADPPSAHPGRGYRNRTHLRERVAAALMISITQKGIRIKVSAARVAPGGYGSALAKYLDAEITQYRRWRHPVFGHDVWVQQTGQPWFFNTITEHADDFRRATLDALDEVRRELSD